MTDRLTEQELQEAERLCEAATPGPWEWDERAPHLLNAPFQTNDPNDTSRVGGDSIILMLNRGQRSHLKKQNAAMIIVGRNLLPRAVAELLELRAIVDRLPVTDDGVHVAPGDKAFLLYATTIGLVIADNVDFEMAYQYCGMDECNPRPAFWLGLYSTLETAQAAKEKSHE